MPPIPLVIGDTIIIQDPDSPVRGSAAKVQGWQPHGAHIQVHGERFQRVVPFHQLGLAPETSTPIARPHFNR